jgi:ABC-type bacteriocin/lantibiotic exporter with double-glycine peptidase domain
MKLILRLLSDFFSEEKVNTLAMVGTSFAYNVIQTNAISSVSARLITTIQKRNHSDAIYFFKCFIFVLTITVMSYYLYRFFQNKILTKLRQYVQYQMIRLLMIINNENFSGANFSRFGAPINRLSLVCFMAFTDIITYILPNIIFIVVIGGYLLYTNLKIGLFFILMNIVLFSYIWYNWNDMKSKNELFEKKVNDSEAYIYEMLNNMDKIISRGQYKQELDIFSVKRDDSVETAYNFYSTTNYHLFISSILILISTIIIIGYFMYLLFDKTVTLTLFITFFNIMLIYRDRMGSLLIQIPDFIEFFGRAEYVLSIFKQMNENYNKLDEHDKKYKSVKLPFREIKLVDVSFKYPEADKYLFEHYSLTLKTEKHKIIGITGLSGNGKSTFMKMVLKMYRCNEGNIYIDGENIEDIDPDYIRANITYVNQNSKLFDKKIIENIMYGCSDHDKCKSHFDEIIKYKKIRELYRNVDIENTQVGALGEKISGGQRQIVNLIGGMINPCKILILDEPTNALDPGLKKEVIGMIKDFKKYKQCIIIITHDRDVFSLFDEEHKV